MTIINQVGQYVKRIRLNGNKGTYNLNTSQFADGIYFYRVNSAGNIQKGVIMITH